jgi:hypothetical protein
MAAQPGIVQRTEQPCVAVRALVTMRTPGEVLPAPHPMARRWLRSRGVPPAGQPFYTYNVIDMDRQPEVEAGFPVAAPATGEDRVLTAFMPAGWCGALWRTGRPHGLVGATGTLLDWAAQQSLALGRHVHARWRALGMPPGGLSRRTRPGHERVGNRTRIQARRLARPQVSRSGDRVMPDARNRSRMPSRTL